MAMQNVTVKLPEEILRQARHMAVDRGMSLSKFVATLVEERIRSSSEFEAARERQTRLMREGLQLGFNDDIPWTRDELHER